MSGERSERLRPFVAQEGNPRGDLPGLRSLRTAGGSGSRCVIQKHLLQKTVGDCLSYGERDCAGCDAAGVFGPSGVLDRRRLSGNDSGERDGGGGGTAERPSAAVA